jgi:hypothetical protein
MSIFVRTLCLLSCNPYGSDVRIVWREMSTAGGPRARVASAFIGTTVLHYYNGSVVYFASVM